MDLTEWTRRAVAANRAWTDGFGPFPEHAATAVTDEAFAPAFAALQERLTENYPFAHPRYAGQMVKPAHPAAVVGYLSAMLLNPNNHALDGGPATARMEREVVASLATMFGFNDHLGHLTTSGTIANLEALYVARSLHPDRGIAYSTEAHYTHGRMCGVLGVTGRPVPVDGTGRMDLAALEDLLSGGEVGTVVVTAGTTGLGVVEPVHEVLAVARRHGVRVHVDAAYGGFFTLLAGRSDAAGLAPEPWAAIAALRLGGRGPAQARSAAVRLRRRAVRRPGGRPLLRPRLAVHVLHLRRAAPGGDQSRVLAGRSLGRRAVADLPGPASDGRGTRCGAGRRPARGAALGRADPRDRGADAVPAAGARHRQLLPDGGTVVAQGDRRRQRRGADGRHERAGGPGLPQHLAGDGRRDAGPAPVGALRCGRAPGSCAAC